jgi:hypothetical protein
MKTFSYTTVALVCCLTTLAFQPSQAQTLSQPLLPGIDYAAHAVQFSTSPQREVLCDSQNGNPRHQLTASECQILIDATPVSANGRRELNKYALKKNRQAWGALSLRAIETLAQFDNIVIGQPTQTNQQPAAPR